MFRLKTLLGGHLSLRNYDAQVGEAMAMAMVKALDDVVGNADQRQARITSAPVGVLYPYRWPILNYSTKPHVVITYQMQIKQHKAF